MAEIKTKQTDADVSEFINSFANTEQKKKDSFELVKIIQEHTSFEPKMWGPSIIGFGVYHYKSERSKQEGDWPLIGFSPRKAALTLYVYYGSEKNEQLIEKLGKFKKSKGCIYVNKLSDIDVEVMKEMITETIYQTKQKWG
jgi:hypothetical protein